MHLSHESPLRVLLDLLLASRINDQTKLLDFGRQLAASLGLPCNPVGANNAKTGTPATYRPVGPTCPPCPVSDICYANFGRVKLHAQRSASSPSASLTAAAVAIAVAVKMGTLARLHVSGDFFDDGVPDEAYINGLIEVAQHVRIQQQLDGPVAWTYTHGDKGVFEAYRLTLEGAGICVLYSDVVEAGGAVVWPFAKLDELRRVHPNQAFLRCPAQLHKAITCRRCLRCITAKGRGECIVFDPHGPRASQLHHVS